ncbi:hypothetical protein A3F00_00185 [Candidatus Daviesbacteria bacterium RIFCSPHIGHO2_12_FULL_37_11]|uniref:Glycosyl transferase family 1 domain-containing protein n=1 Tax=Candidatus Daviesbacteria bacterium RIFCSPHIGHO2_12_FULL_37_11 TaxID=1797777 RepID=A0A1F5KAB0_9BACT|nr:MAG: hypothetical protein A3F00_00185 [Candidatus Daviesbacteria bacterium RIFCSPHIGHO2_12_FULL_37_11]
MKIGIYSPYLDTAGGGERYMMSIAEFLSQSHEVHVFLDAHLFEIGKEKIKEKIESLHGIDLSNVNFIKAPIGVGSSFFERLIFLKSYDLLFYLTDGSIFFSTAKKNILHIQSPLKNTNNDLWGNFKLSSWKLIMYNSKFTKEETENSWKIKNVIVYPPVSVDKIKPLKKEKIILSVGRFSGVSQGGQTFYASKNHKSLIDAFRKLVQENSLGEYSLHIAGAAADGDKKYLEELGKGAKDLKVYLYPNISFDDLRKLYGKALIYWHAAGYGEKDPTKMEHFGITTVEAMAAGCVPIVINLGGQKEIVEHGKSGFLWNNPSELVEDTLKVISNDTFFSKISQKAVKRSKLFSKDKFCQNIQKLL